MSFTVPVVSIPLSTAPVTVPSDGVAAPWRIVRHCARPGCGVIAAATLRFDYAQRVVALVPMGRRAIPGEYDLCEQHAARTSPPSGWTMRDRAPSRVAETESAPPVGPERAPHVGRLAAALSAVPRTVSEDVPDAVPVGTDRSVPHPALAPALAHDESAAQGSPAPAPATAAPSGPARLDVLMGGARNAPVDAADHAADGGGIGRDRAAQDAAEEAFPHARALRLAPDPISSAWCADLMSPDARPVPSRSFVAPSVIRPLGRSGGPPTLFG